MKPYQHSLLLNWVGADELEIFVQPSQDACVAARIGLDAQARSLDEPQLLDNGGQL